jgi:hypothetical protein
MIGRFISFYYFITISFMLFITVRGHGQTYVKYGAYHVAPYYIYPKTLQNIGDRAQSHYLWHQEFPCDLLVHNNSTKTITNSNL